MALNFHEPRCPMAGFDLGIPALVWWFTQAKVIFLYLKLTIWPWPLVICYEIPYLKTVAQAWPWVLAAGLFGLAIFWLTWRRSALGFVGVWMLAILSPTLAIPLLYETVAERRMYLPLAAILPLLIVGGYELVLSTEKSIARRAPKTSNDWGTMVISTVATLLLTLVLGVVSAHRLAAYQDEVTLWQDALTHEPNSFVVQHNLGTSLANAGRKQEAMRHLQQALQLRPDSADAHFNVARALEESGQPLQAIRHYQEVTRLKPNFAAAHYNLGVALGSLGRSQEALTQYEEAVRVMPDFADAQTNLGASLLSAGRIQEAIIHLEEALKLTPDVESHANLAFAYAQANRSVDAIATARKAVELARSKGETSLAEQIEAWLITYRVQVPQS